MDLALLKMLKQAQKLTNEELARKAGIPVGTLNKILSGATKSPRHESVQAIAKALKGNSYDTDTAVDADMLREALSYDISHKYTLDDYYSLSDEVRTELIDGSFYFMEAPGANHQSIIGELYYIIKSHIKKNKGSCKVFISPFDVRLNNDNNTMVQPDVFVICDRSKLDGKRCNGAPDFLAEVVSESSGKLDYLIKLNKYMTAGVREYWIIDPVKRMVTVYPFEKDDVPQYYGFTDKIPLGIFEGLIVDFNEINDEIISFG